MSEIFGMLPFFTGRDEKILYGESVRDPLGLLPIWSAVGHELIPGLASIVSRIDGIQGVLFIYACLNELPHFSVSNLPDDKILRFLERLWEYHLFQYGNKKDPCFGITSLSGADFQLSTSSSGVVGTGLRQYYRGSCVNKCIMEGNLRSLKEPYSSYAKALLNVELINWLKRNASKMHGDDYSISARKEYEKLRPSLERFSQGSFALWQALKKSLIVDAQQQCWLEHVATQPNWKSVSLPDLVTSLQEYAREVEDKILQEQCQRILDCEPFVQLLEVIFQMAQEEGRTTIAKLSSRLRNSAPVNLHEICNNFRRINFKSKRLASLKKLAISLGNEEYSLFLSSFLHDYYGSVCKDRGKNPIVYIDGADIIALKPGKSGNDWRKPIDSSKWNGYFIKSQVSLYVDLMQRMESPNA